MTDPARQDPAARRLPRLLEESAALRAASAATARDRSPVELDRQSVGRPNRMDAIERQATAAAIRRIETGDFGRCDACGEAIGAGRLDLGPTVVRRRDRAG